MEKTRIDKWLWMVRIFKTRSMASDSCNAGKVKIGGDNYLPSREVKTNEEIQVRIGQLLKTVKVLDFPKNRLPAKLTPEYYEDLTPQEEYERIKMLHEHVEYREHGLGRPTKRDRRQLDYLKDFLSDTEDWE